MSVEGSSATRPGLRDRTRAAIEPRARVLGRLGLTPNALTLIGFGIAIVAAVVASTQAWLAAGLLVAFGAAFDLLDGALARATGTTSRLGAFMDSVFDRGGEAVVYVGIAIGLTSVAYSDVTFLAIGIGATAGAMAASFMVSYTRAKSESLGFSSGRGMANVGLAPREVRVVILAAGLVVGGLVTDEHRWWYVLVGSLGLIAVLATITTIQRIVFVYRQSRTQEVND